MPCYRYQIFIPGGNKTALVLGVDGLDSDGVLRKAIQNKIFAKHKTDADGEVEQVGFVSVDKSAPQLIMAGGEFCGNATRSAAAYYFQQPRNGDTEIKVSGTSKPVKAGLSSKGTRLEAWAEMPIIEDYSSAFLPLKGGLYWVSIEGISHLIVPQVQSVSYLNRILSCENEDAQKNIAFDVLKKTSEENSLSPGKAYGVIFLENIAGLLRMHPFVHVVESDTTYYETACGSGAMCVGLLNSFLSRESANLPVLQPSGKIIRVETGCSDAGEPKRGKISGEVLIGDTCEVDLYK